VVLYTELLCYHPYLVSMLFADLLSLQLVTVLMILFFIDKTLYILKLASVCFNAV